MMLAVAMMLAPLLGVTDSASTELHRVDMDGIPVATWGEADWATAACGAQVKLLEAEWRHVRTRGTPYRRCPNCRSAT